MNRDSYFADPGVNWSTLKMMRDSPLAYRHAVDVGREDTDILREGRLLHTLVLEPHRVAADYAVWTGKVRSGKVWDAFEQDHSHLCIVTPAQMETTQAMADAVLRNHAALRYLRAADAEVEQSLHWTDAATGLQCKARADVIVPSLRALCDLKSAASIDARRFGLQAARLGYHCQLAHYNNGVQACRGWAPERRKFIVVEKAPPHDVAVFDLIGPDHDIAQEELAALLLRVRECADAGAWPGRYTDEQPLHLPAYIQGETEIEYT